MSTLERVRDNVPETIRLLKRTAGVSDAQIGRALGLSRAVANQRVLGTSQWSYAELAALAEFFGVPVGVIIEGDPQEVVKEAINERDLLNRRFAWNHNCAGQAVRGRAA